MICGATSKLSTKEQLAAGIIEQFLKSSKDSKTGCNLVSAIAVIYETYLRQNQELSVLRNDNATKSEEISLLRKSLADAYDVIQVVDSFHFDLFQ